jgi:hypothetical protein
MRWLVLGLGVATYLSAAKAHGRQLRIERELAGYWHVRFGGDNPAWVEALWSRERLAYWSLAAALAVATIVFRALAARFDWPLPLGSRSVAGGFVLHLVVPLSGAFVVTGLLSVARFALRAGSAAPSEGWLSGAAWGSAGWWTLTLAMGAALCLLAWRRPA